MITKHEKGMVDKLQFYDKHRALPGKEKLEKEITPQRMIEVLEEYIKKSAGNLKFWKQQFKEFLRTPSKLTAAQRKEFVEYFTSYIKVYEFELKADKEILKNYKKKRGNNVVEKTIK